MKPERVLTDEEIHQAWGEFWDAQDCSLDEVGFARRIEALTMERIARAFRGADCREVFVVSDPSYCDAAACFVERLGKSPAAADEYKVTDICKAGPLGCSVPSHVYLNGVRYHGGRETSEGAVRDGMTHGDIRGRSREGEQSAGSTPAPDNSRLARESSDSARQDDKEVMPPDAHDGLSMRQMPTHSASATSALGVSGGGAQDEAEIERLVILAQDKDDEGNAIWTSDWERIGDAIDGLASLARRLAKERESAISIAAHRGEEGDSLRKQLKETQQERNEARTTAETLCPGEIARRANLPWWRPR